MRRPERFQATFVIWRCGTGGSRSVKGLILRAFAAFCPPGAGGIWNSLRPRRFSWAAVWPHGGSQLQDIKYRLVNPGLRPRKTKLEMPGWAGKPAPRTDGSHEYAWHCAPFTEGAQYGIEIFYPYENELHVTKQSGEFAFDGDFGPPARGRPAMAAVPQLRQGVLHLSASARSESRQGLGSTHRAAPALLHRHNRHRS